jgi:hypothetical protein
MIMNNDAVAIKPYSLSELAELYGVTNRTMRNWLTSHKDQIGERIGWLYNARQVKLIFEILGLPGKFEE